MANDINRSIKVYLDTQEASMGVDKLVTKIGQLEKKLIELSNTEGANSNAVRKVQSDLTKNQKTLDSYQQKIQGTEKVLKNLSGATYGELLAVKDQMSKALKKETRGTEEHKQKLQVYEKVCNEVSKAQAEMNTQIGCQGTAMGKAAGFVNKYIGLIGSGVVSISAINNKIQESVDKYAIVTDELADIRKTTGMDAEEADSLNESLGKIDTRTLAAGLREIAAVGGQLGIKKDDIYAFTDSIDKLNVALGDEFGGGAENVAKEVGTLRNVLVDMKSNDISSDMLHIGNAINELGAAGFATAPIITDFTNRIGGIAIPLGVSSGEVLGLSAALQEMNITAERGGTAVTKIMQKMLQDPSKFAKVAKMDIKGFTEMLNKDLMGALLKVSEGVSKDSGSAVQFAAILDELKLTGSGASEVFSKLGTNTELVREKIDLASKSLQDTNSVMDEFNIKNNTEAALQEKRKKQWEEISNTIGKIFTPAVSSGADASLKLAKAGIEVLKYLNANKGLVLTLIIVMGTYTASVKLYTYWQALANAESVKDVVIKKLKVFWDKACTAASLLHAAAVGYLTGGVRAANLMMKTFFATLGLNPFVAIGVAIAAVVVALYQFTMKGKELTQVYQSQLNISKKVDDEYSTQEAKIKILIDTLNNEKLALDQRREALAQLKEIIPGYHASLTNEGVLINNNTEAIKEYLIQLEREIKLKAAQEELEELYRSKRTQEKDLKKKQKTADSFTTQGIIGSGDARVISGMQNASLKAQGDAENAGKALKLTQDAISEIEKEVQAGMEEISKSKAYISIDIKEGSKKIENGITYIYKSGKWVAVPSYIPDGDTAKESVQKKQLDTQLQTLENNYKLRLLVIEKNDEKEWKTEEQKQQLIINSENKYLTERIDFLKRFQTSHAKLREDSQQKQLESEIKLQQNQAKLDEIAIKEKQISRDKSLKNELSNYERKKAGFEKQFADQTITQEQYDGLMLGLEYSTSEARRLIWAEYQKDIVSLEIKTGTLKEKAIEDANAGLMNAELKSAQDRRKVLDTIANSEKDLKKFAGISTPESDLQLQLSMLKSMYDTRIDLARKAGATEQELERITTAFTLAQNRIRANSDEERFNLRKNLGLTTWQEEYGFEKQQLKQQFDEGIINEEDYQSALKEVRVTNAKKWFDYFSGLASGAISALQQAEMASVDEKYDAEIAAAGENKEEVERLETEKAQKKLDIEKKYADVNFAIKASEIIANTAVAVMQAFAQLGPIAGGIAAALMGVTGAAQLVVANKERQRIKSMTLNGSGSAKKTGERVVKQAARGKYDVIGEEDGQLYKNVPFEGTPETGLVKSPTLYGEKGSEMVISHEDFKRLERHINYPLVVSAIQDARNNVVPQRASGKYDNITEPGGNEIHNNEYNDKLLLELILLIKSLRESGVPAFIVWDEYQKALKLMEQSKKTAQR